MIKLNRLRRRQWIWFADEVSQSLTVLSQLPGKLENCYYSRQLGSHLGIPAYISALDRQYAGGLVDAVGDEREGCPPH
jgi:hypothetical protein